MKEKPLIGVSGPDRGGVAAWFFTRLAVWRAGGRSLRIVPQRPVDMKMLDGLVLGGGADIDPGLYGEDDVEPPTGKNGERDPLLQPIINWLIFPLVYIPRKLLSAKQYHLKDRERDTLEGKLIRHALSRNLPILGICRGAQLLNIHFGGTLHQSLHEFYEEIPRQNSILPKKRIRISHGSKLWEITRKDRDLVNSLHRQAIAEPGKGLRVVATEENGVVQAVEGENYPFLLGVQWHPEYMPQYKSQKALFKTLVEASARQRKGSSS